MKKILAALVFVMPNLVFAQHYYGHRHHNHHVHRHYAPNWWVAPVVIGTAIGAGYALTRPTYAQQTVIIDTNQVVIDGVIYTKQIMIINGVQTEVLVKQ